MTRTRFAPSPTGYIHIGNLRTALYAYLIAKHDNGKFILRIEDTDQERFVQDAVDLIYKALKETHLNHDEGPDIGGNYAPYIQSQRKDIYKKYVHELIENQKAYYCFCDKNRLDTVRKQCEEKKITAKYDGYCKTLPLSVIEANLKSGKPYVIRQSIPDSGTTTFSDAVFGDITVENSILDDQVLIKSDGFPTYNFANVVDDHLMEITHVVRGIEYLSSTPKYNLLYKAFGWEIPVYIHVPPIMKSAAAKLSKRSGDASYEDFVNKGYLPDALLNYILLLGWNPGDNREIFSLEEMVKEFDVNKINKAPAIFNELKLNWMNKQYILKLPLESFHEKALPYLKQSIVHKDINLLEISRLLQQRIEKFSDIPANIDFIDVLPEYDISLYTNKKMKTDIKNSLENLCILLPVLQSITDWNEKIIHDTVIELISKLGVKNGQVLWPLRVALSGKESSPCGGIELMFLFGRKESINRIEKAIEKLQLWDMNHHDLEI
ncbi:MAG: glutamate--tRNA ligase [Candidatus Firestonebacteria bacterium]|nr:glutamate--tRNA ligase [Candidatus Firestonebacteria bacterium]